MSVAAELTLGGAGRVVLVVGDDRELATSLRDRLDRAWVTVLDVRPGEEADALRLCRPWPWMVAGAGPRLPPPLVGAVRDEPMLVAWRGPAPPALPSRAVACARFGDLVTVIEEALHEQRGGMRLCIGGGVEMPGGEVVGDRALEALVAVGGKPLPLTPRRAAAVARTLARHRIQLRPVGTPAGVVLAARGPG